MDIELNDDWIKKFKETDKLYQDFYKDDVYYINTRFVYINKSGDIERIKQESYLMNTKNYISREEMIGLLNRYSSCILRKSQTYESIKTKLYEFAQGDFTTERRHQITNQLINLIIKKCEKREPETDTEEDDD